MYDLLTNKTYGLGIAEANVDRFKFYRVAKYCDACDDVTGQFIGVDGIVDEHLDTNQEGNLRQ